MKILILILMLTQLSYSLMSGTASTTRYWDCSGGACGCGFGNSKQPTHCHSNAMFPAPAGNEYGAKFYGSAALSKPLGGGDWLAPGCGKCFRVSAQGSTVVLKGTNYCPPDNDVCNGQAHFDIAAPGYDYPGASISNTCKQVGEEQALHPPQICAYKSIQDCNCDGIQDETLRNGCNNFKSLGWDNPQVQYTEVKCPPELSAAPPCWEQNGETWPSSSPPRCSAPSDKPSNPKYQCTGGTCLENSAGSYNSLAECQSACSPSDKKYSCVDDKTCTYDPAGQYNSLDQCQQACGEVPTGKWDCADGGCSRLSSGSFTTRDQCLSTCTSSYSFGDACKEHDDDLCGEECSAANCKWSWPTNDPDKWNSKDAKCRCAPSGSLEFLYKEFMNYH